MNHMFMLMAHLFAPSLPAISVALQNEVNFAGSPSLEPFLSLLLALRSGSASPETKSSRLCRRCTLFAADPFRPVRPPLEPMIINAIQDLLETGKSPADVASEALKLRAADPDYTLTAEEESLLTRRVLQVGAASDALVSLIESAVDATPWVAKYGATETFGIGAISDPYVRLCRAESMLAALILHIEGGKVNFIGEENLEVLRDAPAPETVEAVRVIIASAVGDGE